MNLSQDTTSAFLDRFDRFDGAFLHDLAIDLHRHTVILGLQAFDSGARHRWCRVVIAVARDLEFSLYESSEHTLIQLDDHLDILWFDGRVYLVLDPLQAQDFEAPGWSLEQVRRSRCYVGGEVVTWSVEDLP